MFLVVVLRLPAIVKKLRTSNGRVDTIIGGSYVTSGFLYTSNNCLDAKSMLAVNFKLLLQTGLDGCLDGCFDMRI